MSKLSRAWDAFCEWVYDLTDSREERAKWYALMTALAVPLGFYNVLSGEELTMWLSTIAAVATTFTAYVHTRHSKSHTQSSQESSGVAEGDETHPPAE